MLVLSLPTSRLHALIGHWTDIRSNNGGDLNYITPKAEVFNFTGQDSDGELWSSLGLLTNLEYLGHSHRPSMHGTIPTELGLMTALQEVHLAHLPKITGTVPSELGLLTKLTKLDLSESGMTGTLPSELCTSVEGGLLDLVANCGDTITCCS